MLSESDVEIDTFGIVLPDEWVRIPLDGADFEEFVRGQRRRLSGDGELSPTAVRQFELMMRQMRNDCRREHVTFAATLLTVVDEVESADDEEAVDAGLLTAACTINTMDRTEMGSELPLTVNTIAAAMGRQPEPDDDGLEVTNLEKPAIVDLPAGPAVKLVRLHKYPPSLTTGERVAVFAQHMLVPFGGGQRAAVVTFSTVTLQYARPLSHLFDKMMETFRMFGGDMPTDPTIDPRGENGDEPER